MTETKIGQGISNAASRKHQSPSLEILGPPWKLAIISGIAGSLALLIWSFVARVPVRVQGLGILFPTMGVDRFVTSDYGRVHLFFGEPAKSNNPWFQEVLPFLRNIKDLNGDEAERAADLLLIHLVAANRQNLDTKTSRYDRLNYPYRTERDSLILYAESPEQASSLLYSLQKFKALNQAFQEIKDKRIRLEKTIHGQQKQRQQLASDLKSLEDIGFISKPAVLANLAALDAVKTQSAELQIEQSKLQSERLTALAELKMALNRFAKTSLVYSDYPQTIHQVSVESGSYVKPRIPVILYSNSDYIYPKKIPVFFSSRAVSQIKIGNTGYATPLGYPRSQVGGISLKIEKVTQMSEVDQQLESQFGLTGFSKNIEKNIGPSTLVIANLERDYAKDSPSPYKWSIVPSYSIGYPQMHIGDEMAVEVITRYEAPIGFVMPFFRKVLGIEPPDIRLLPPKAKMEEKK